MIESIVENKILGQALLLNHSGYTMSKFKKQNDITTELQLILHCAPVLRGIKAANTVRLLFTDLEKSIILLKGSGITCICLYQDNTSAIVLLYRKERLLGVMNQMDICTYMLALGYQPLDIEGSLLRLQRKMFDYYLRDKRFPHELGVFLEYPLNDILQYMKQDGKNYLINGYWKVYDREDEARKIFQRYEDAKKMMISHYLKFGTLNISRYSL